MEDGEKKPKEVQSEISIFSSGRIKKSHLLHIRM
jgi:hypothetical protein